LRSLSSSRFTVQLSGGPVQVGEEKPVRPSFCLSLRIPSTSTVTSSVPVYMRLRRTDKLVDGLTPTPKKEAWSPPHSSLHVSPTAAMRKVPVSGKDGRPKTKLSSCRDPAKTGTISSGEGVMHKSKCSYDLSQSGCTLRLVAVIKRTAYLVRISIFLSQRAPESA
jgi:hypothetical protein